ncbi:MAG: hypothetical protein ACHREM_08980 [Polyangiales bacterium]
MGITKRGSRTLTVDGRLFRFLIKETTVPDHKDQKELRVTVQEETDRPGNVLQFRGDYGVPMTVNQVGWYIKQGLAQGWDPAKRGAAFKFNDAISSSR